MIYLLIVPSLCVLQQLPLTALLLTYQPVQSLNLLVGVNQTLDQQVDLTAVSHDYHGASSGDTPTLHTMGPTEHQTEVRSKLSTAQERANPLHWPRVPITTLNSWSVLMDSLVIHFKYTLRGIGRVSINRGGTTLHMYLQAWT